MCQNAGVSTTSENRGDARLSGRVTATSRVYGGKTADERRSKRREQLLAAGLEVFAAQGWSGTTVLDVCRAAGLSQRYFYEAFEGREELFEAIVERVEEEVVHTVREHFGDGEGPEARVSAALGALAELFVDDPRKAQVTMVESFATGRFRRRRERSLASFADFAADQLRELSGPDSEVDVRGIEIAAFVLVGGIAESLVAGVTGQLRISPEELVEHTTRLFLAAVSPPLAPVALAVPPRARQSLPRLGSSVAEPGRRA